MLSSILFAVAFAQPAPEWLTWEQLQSSSPPFALPTGRHPSPAGTSVPERWVMVNARGEASAPFPRGPVALVVSPELRGEGIVALYEALHEAGSEPVLVRGIRSTHPEQVEVMRLPLAADAFAVPVDASEYWRTVGLIPPQWVRLDDREGPRFDDWSRCSATVAPLVPSLLPFSFDADRLPFTDDAARADQLLSAVVAFDATGHALSPLTAGPVVVHLDPDLRGEGIASVMDQLHQAGAQPLLLRRAKGRPPGTLGGPDMPFPEALSSKRTVAAWAEHLRICQAGRALLAGRCEDREAQWRAVLEDPSCEASAVPDQTLMQAVEEPLLGLEPWVIEPRGVPFRITTRTGWGDIDAVAPSTVQVVAVSDVFGQLPEMHESEVRWKKTFKPVYPPMDSANTQREVDLALNRAGKPTMAVATGCSEPFAVASEEAAKQWRAEPSGRDVHVQVRFRFTDR